jgi:formate dehydrogenase maturation protein FdhE
MEGPLRFYAALAVLQEALIDQNESATADTAPEAPGLTSLRQGYGGPPKLLRRRKPGPSGPNAPQAQRLRLRPDAHALPPFIDALAREAPPNVAQGLASLKQSDVVEWTRLIDSYWTSGGREPGDADELRLFVVEAFLQPFAEASATRAESIGPAQSAFARQESPSFGGQACPKCTGLPIVAVLREAGHGARRSLLCGLCLTEWPAMRVVCTSCGESQFEKLPVFGAEEFAARIDACDSCQAYIKTIDLTRDGAAVPLVDDLATLPLDLWARERGYKRARPNLLRL